MKEEMLQNKNDYEKKSRLKHWRDIQLMLLLSSLLWLVACGKLTSREDLYAAKLGDSQAPELVSPVNEAKVQQKTTLVWSSRQNAVFYEVQIAEDASFTQQISGSPFEVESTDGNSPPPTQLEVTFPDSKSYYWRVRSSGMDEGQYSQSQIVHVFGDAVYVYCPGSVSTCSEDTDGDGKDDTVGNKSKPFRTFQKAMAEAVSLGIKVYVAQRDASNAPYTEPINLVSGARLYGGYDSSIWTRSAGDRTKITGSTTKIISITFIHDKQSTIASFEITSNSTNSSNYVIYIENSDNNVTIQDSLINGSTSGLYTYGIYNLSSSPNISSNTIDGGSGSNSYGIYNESNSSPNISNNTIDGGNAGGTAYGISNKSSSPSISNNTINGGSGSSKSYGINNESNSSPSISNNTINGGSTGTFSFGINNSSSSPNISNNTISGGSAVSFSYGIYNNSSSPSISNNTINGGESINSRGIHNLSSSPSISNNTINGGSGSTSSHGIYNLSSSSSIDNNILYAEGSTARYGIYEGSPSSDPASVKNNLIFDAGSGGSFALYYDQGSTALSDSNTSTNPIDWSTSPNNGGNPVSGNLTLTATPAQTIADVFKYYPTEILYTQDGNGNSTYDGSTTTLEVATSDCSNFLANEYFEYLYDNTPRRITSNCTANAVNFTPALNYDLGAGVPILRWGSTNTNYDKKYSLKTGSPALNAGLVGTTNGGSCSNYTVKTQVWGTAANQDECDSKFPNTNATFNGGNCETKFLYPAVEIFDDNIGNDNGLCESNETCLHNPNMGAYAGHGTLSTYASCSIPSPLTNIALMKYDSNGYP